MSKYRYEHDAVLPVFVKRMLWNVRYAFLNYPRWQPPPDAILCLREGLKEDGSLLDLGCGAGGLLRGLRQAGWTGDYCGVDISRHAIRDACSFVDLRSTWAISAIESFQSPLKWDAVSFIESIYYVSPQSVQAVLQQVTQMLKENGFILVRIHDFQKHRAYVDVISGLPMKIQRIGETLIKISRPMALLKAEATTSPYLYCPI